jgi:diguanylate cyclase (GGDEF)-like protein
MHKLLAEQIAQAKTERGTVDVDRLIGLVSRAYQEFDRDRRRTDRSMSLMVEEIGTVQRDLERLVTERTEELRAREADLHAQNMRFNAAISNMSQGLVMFDSHSRLVICNSRYAEMYRLRPDEVRPGLTLRQLLERRAAAGTFMGDPDQYLEALAAAIEAGATTSQFVELDDGRTIAVVNVPMAGGGWVATHEDITERRRSEMQIAHMARHDALTDLPNRVLLRERLTEALIHVERGQRLAVLCLDLDHFKNVNDSLGHLVGDELLRAVAARLRGCVRETDTISRVGGDEFAIIQTDINDATDAERLALRLSEVIAEPYDLGGHMVVVGTSIGIAVAPVDGIDASELLKNGDMALYGAKADGRGVYRFFEPRMDARMKARRALELALRKALANDEFELYYQPAVTLDGETVQCCEALLRWNHPEHGW